MQLGKPEDAPSGVTSTSTGEGTRSPAPPCHGYLVFMLWFKSPMACGGVIWEGPTPSVSMSPGDPVSTWLRHGTKCPDAALPCGPAPRRPRPVDGTPALQAAYPPSCRAAGGRRPPWGPSRSGSHEAAPTVSPRLSVYGSRVRGRGSPSDIHTSVIRAYLSRLSSHRAGRYGRVAGTCPASTRLYLGAGSPGLSISRIKAGPQLSSSENNDRRPGRCYHVRRGGPAWPPHEGVGRARSSRPGVGYG